MNNPKKEDDNLPIGSLMKSMNHFFHEEPVRGFLQTIDDFFKNPFPFSYFRVELVETDTEYMVKAELPGIKKEQIQLDIFHRSIIITVHNEEEWTKENSKQNKVKKQHSVQKTSRTIPFPHPINEKMINAAYENGLLQIRVAKPKGKRILLD